MSEDGWGQNIGASYDPETDTYHAKYEPGEPGSLSGAVIYLVSAAVGDEPESMDPLYETVDAYALEAIFRPREEQTVQVKFQYCGHEVTVLSDGEVMVTPLEDND